MLVEKAIEVRRFNRLWKGSTSRLDLFLDPFSLSLGRPELGIFAFDVPGVRVQGDQRSLPVVGAEERSDHKALEVELFGPDAIDVGRKRRNLTIVVLHSFLEWERSQRP